MNLGVDTRPGIFPNRGTRPSYYASLLSVRRSSCSRAQRAPQLLCRTPGSKPTPTATPRPTAGRRAATAPTCRSSLAPQLRTRARGPSRCGSPRARPATASCSRAWTERARLQRARRGVLPLRLVQERRSHAVRDLPARLVRVVELLEVGPVGECELDLDQGDVDDSGGTDRHHASRVRLQSHPGRDGHVGRLRDGARVRGGGAGTCP